MNWKNRKGFVAGIFVWLAIFIAYGSTQAAEFCVNSASGLLDALGQAQANGADDVIRLVQGTYVGNFVYSAQEANSLSIQGGYTAGCASRQVNSANTVLDGNEGATVLVLNATAAANFSVDSLTLRNGNTTTNSNGGGIYAATVGGGTFSLSNSTVTANAANFYGGGVYVNGITTVTMTGNDINGNSSGNNGGTLSYGGGVYIGDGTTVTLTNNIINGNVGQSSPGGGVCITFCTTVTLTNNVINGNTGQFRGGGVYVSGTGSTVVTLANNDISGNDMGVWWWGYGGGVYVENGSVVTLTNNGISSNTGGDQGGGIYISSSGVTTLTNNVITNNMAGENGSSTYGYGGGIYLSGLNRATLTNNTISYNKINEYSTGGCGGGLVIMLSDNGDLAEIYNNIIWDNQGRNNCNLKTYNHPTFGNEIYIDNDANNEWNWSPVTMFNNDLDPSDTAFFIAETSFKTEPAKFDNNIDSDPLFVDPETDDYHLTASSSCIDAGDNEAPALPGTDMDGEYRIMSNTASVTVDIGADEYPGSFWDTTKPTGTIKINNNAAYTNNTAVTLNLTCTDTGSGCSQMRFSNDSTNWSTWETFATTKSSWTLATGDGEKTVWAQYKDAAGNESATVYDKITLDTTKPTVISTTPSKGATGVAPNSAVTINWSETIDCATVTTSTVTISPTTGWSRTSCSGSQAVFTPSGQGSLTKYTVTVATGVKDVAGNPMAANYAFYFTTTTVDTTPPNAPVVSGTTPTNDTTPTWTWTSGGGGGNGEYRYRLDSGSWSTETTVTSYTPSTALTAATHTLEVQERDDAENWSASGSKAIVIDTTAPNKPVVSGTTPTNDTTPTWTWTSGGGGNGKYRYKLDSSDLSTGATETTATTYTPASALTVDKHTLYVQERDAAGNWSTSGSKEIDIDTTAPNAPAVNCPKLTRDTTPTWTWVSDGTGNGLYRYSLDSDSGPWSDETKTTDYTPEEPLSPGSHTLYVQERDDAGNWSVSSDFKSGTTLVIARQ